MAKIEVRADTQCWLWTGAKSLGGYGVAYYGGRQMGAHQATWLILRGDLPASNGLVLDHLCRNRPCVNPDHLEPVTDTENKLRSPLVGRAWQRAGSLASQAKRLARDACPHGHAWTTENTYWRGVGGRTCRACNREARRRYVDRMINPSAVTA